jgi:nitroreductase
MESFLELAKSRYSCRNFQPRPVDEKDLMKVLEAGRIAPSAANLQPWYFVVVREQEQLKKVKSCYHRNWIDSAPCVIVICGDHSRSWKRDDGKDHCDIDVAIAVDHMTLAAADAVLEPAGFASSTPCVVPVSFPFLLTLSL